eukprot:TRINITY_DN18138_c0_g1_i2.p1 TRINITY_DN18138_c0_g1~~TRINITY_DN18138_c0_g1_i2.p1  ORF type:complete len:238 (-),score=15.67 TRINITY_DN18138_c0_g1_i2:125-838(-)
MRHFQLSFVFNNILFGKCFMKSNKFCGCHRFKCVQNEDKIIYLQEEQVSKSPWELGFQLNERYLAWDTSKDTQLILLVVAQKMGKEVEYVEEKVGDVCRLIPDIASKISNMKPDLLLTLIDNIDVVPQKCIRLKELLPSVDISQMISRGIPLFLNLSIEEIEQNLCSWEKELGVSRDLIGQIVMNEPQFLQTKALDVVQEIKRLLPNQDPRAIILRDPGSVLSMTQAGQQSSVERIQ